MKKLKLSETALESIIQLIKDLNPRPGSKLTNTRTEYIIPDILVWKKNQRWQVELNPDVIPRVRVNNEYADILKKLKNENDTKFFKNNLQEARWFIKSLQSRHETLLKVASYIVEYQRDFLEYGEEAMKPLVLHRVSEQLNMHESTVSRVTTQKYMHTPRGI